MGAGLLRTRHLQGGGLAFRTCIKRLWTLKSMVWRVTVIGLGIAVLTVVPVVLAGLLTLVSVANSLHSMQAKSERLPPGETAEQPSPCKKGGESPLMPFLPLVAHCQAVASHT